MLYAMLIPAAVLLALFHFYPLWGISLAFVDYNPFKGVRGSAFVGLDIFRDMLRAPAMGLIVRNTLLIASGKIVFGQFASLIFALLIHQVAQPLFRRLVQTVTTLPHFMSWVVIGGAMVQIMSTTGVVNATIGALGGGPIRFLGDPTLFPWTMVLSQTWKEFGFGAIIYLAALTTINPDLYEAAAVDGAGPAARLRHITLPGITPTIVLMACLSLGNVLNAGFEQVLVLYNPMVYSTGDILDTFVYRSGILEAKFSLAAAVGLLKSVVGFFLILLSYWLADRLANYRIF
jgi:putative aldouronate transport system permease protein